LRESSPRNTTHLNRHGCSGGEGVGGGRGGCEGGGGDEGYGGSAGGDGLVGGGVKMYVAYPLQWQHATSGVASTA